MYTNLGHARRAVLQTHFSCTKLKIKFNFNKAYTAGIRCATHCNDGENRNPGRREDEGEVPFKKLQRNFRLPALMFLSPARCALRRAAVVVGWAAAVGDCGAGVGLGGDRRVALSFGRRIVAYASGRRSRRRSDCRSNSTAPRSAPGASTRWQRGLAVPAIDVADRRAKARCGLPARASRSRLRSKTRANGDQGREWCSSNALRDAEVLLRRTSAAPSVIETRLRSRA